MPHVKTPEETLALIENEFCPVAQTEFVPLGAAMGRTLPGAEGWFVIDRDCEGLPRGAEIQVTITQGE